MQTKPKSRFSRLMMATLAGTIALGGAAATMARAEADSNDAARAQALGAAKLTLADAIGKAEAAGQGIVTGAEVETDTAGNYFMVTTQNGTTEIDHKIDLMTGDILASTPKDEKADTDGDMDGDKAQGQTDEAAMIQGAKVGLLQAIADAEAQSGKVLSAEYGHENGVLAIDLTVVDAAGMVSEMIVDADTGKATMGGADSTEDGEDGSDDEAKEG